MQETYSEFLLDVWDEGAQAGVIPASCTARPEAGDKASIVSRQAPAKVGDATEGAERSAVLPRAGGALGQNRKAR